MLITCEDAPLLNSHHTSWLLVIRRRSSEMTAELVVTIVLVLEKDGSHECWLKKTCKFSKNLTCLLIVEGCLVSILRCCWCRGAVGWAVSAWLEIWPGISVGYWGLGAAADQSWRLSLHCLAAWDQQEHPWENTDTMVSHCLFSNLLSGELKFVGKKI